MKNLKCALAGLLPVVLFVIAVNSNGLKTATSNVKQKRAGLIRHNYIKGEITKLCDAGLADFSSAIAAGFVDAYMFEAKLADLNDLIQPLTFMGYVHSDEAIRAEGSACEEKVGPFMVEVFTNRGIYQIILNTKTRHPKEQRLISELKRSFEQNGMALDNEKLSQFKELKQRLSVLEAQFSKNLNEDQTSITLSQDELAGVTADFLGRLKKTPNGLYIVTTKRADYDLLMDNATNPETRKKMNIAYDSRAGDKNIKLLEQAISLRQQIATITGFKTWADYRIEGRMAKTGDEALALLNDLRVKLKPRLKSDMAIQLKTKQEMEDANATELKSWDLRFFANQVKKRDYSLDDEVIREYFPKDLVMNGLFDVYSTLLGVRFEEVQNADVWFDTVKLYAIKNKHDDKIIAYFYTDLFPRVGKYGHAAAFPIISGRLLPTNDYSVPVASMVANFTPPTANKPSLLTHDEVETLFHEFGHIMHQTLTRAPYAYLSGSSTTQDFVEAPSQMLENWVWSADILKSISGHYLDHKKHLPDELITKMVAAHDFNIGFHYSRQIVLGLTDLKMHVANGAVDASDLYRQTFKDVLDIEPVEGSAWMAGFGHMMGGYDAGYYGYIWSEVYAADMFTAFEATGLLNAVTGHAYRTNILEKGNMQDPIEMVTGFLGRKPNNEAFLKKLGL